MKVGAVSLGLLHIEDILNQISLSTNNGATIINPIYRENELYNGCYAVDEIEDLEGYEIISEGYLCDYSLLNDFRFKELKPIFTLGEYIKNEELRNEVNSFIVHVYNTLGEDNGRNVYIRYNEYTQQLSLWFYSYLMIE